MSEALQRGLLLLGQNRHELAAEQFGRHLATEPNDPHAHALLAMCLSDAEQFGDATQHAQDAIRLAPDFPFAHYAMAYVMADRNRFKEALAAINEAIRLDPYDADYFALLSRVHLSESRHQPALDAAEQGLQIDAENVTCQNLRAMALKNLGRHMDAAQALEGALARNPENAVTHANKGWALLEKNQPDEALKHFQEALRIDPTLDWAREGIVTALKARYKIYGVMLKYFLWMSKLSGQKQWVVVLGVYFGSRFLAQLGRSKPELAPYIFPLRMLIFAFAILTWLADPLFNLALRCNRYGRLALSDDQRRSSTLVGACIALALICVASAAFTKEPIVLLGAGAGIGLLSLPISTIFRLRLPWQRRVMSLYTVVMTVALAAAFVGLFVGETPEGKVREPYSAIAGLGLLVYVAGLIGCPWVSNILLMWRSRR
jgi:tetratricopeptide (TPR) repeat protein